jgi:hypothetical protein
MVYTPTEEEINAKMWLYGLSDWQGAAWERWRTLSPNPMNHQQVYKAAVQVQREFEEAEPQTTLIQRIERGETTVEDAQLVEELLEATKQACRLLGALRAHTPVGHCMARPERDLYQSTQAQIAEIVLKIDPKNKREFKALLMEAAHE